MDDIQHAKAEMLVRTLNPGAALHTTHEGGRFCLRAERWDGHKTFGDSVPIHDFVSLENLLRSVSGEHTADVLTF